MKPIAMAVASRAAGLLDIFSEGPDTAMFHKTFANGWTDWDPLAGVFNYPPAAVALDSTTLDAFAIGTDYAMFHKSWSNGVWSPSQSTWESLGGVFDSPPAAVSWAANRIDVFGIGGNKEVFHKVFDGSQFSPTWESLGGEFVGGLAAVSWGLKRIDLFAVSTNQIMFHKFFDGTQWHPSQTGWESLGGLFTSPPAAAAWGPDRLDVFAVGTDFAMLHRAWDGTQWRAWDTLGGTFNSQPAVASWAVNRLDVFGLGTNNSIFHKFWDGAWQGTWENLGGAMGSAPAVVAWGPSRLDLFGVATNRTMLHKFFDGTQWSPSETGWDSFGGVFDNPPVPGPAAGPPFGLGSNSNYYLSSNCDPLLDVSVIIDVTEDIVCQSVSKSTLGFSFQLNAYSPQGDLCAYQQYTIALLNNEVTGGIDNWSLAGVQNNSDLFHDFPSLVSLPEAKLSAGFILKILLENDKTGNVIGVRWVVIDNLGNELVNQRESTFTAGGDAAQLAPIVAFELDFVGPNDGAQATLSSGAGTITYKASNVMTVTGDQAPCTPETLVTIETANTFYGFLPTGSSKSFTQSFRVNPGEPAIDKPGKHLPGLRRP